MRGTLPAGDRVGRKPGSDAWSVLDETAPRAGDETRRAERVLRAVFDTSPDTIFVHAADGTVLDVNDRILDMYGYERAEVLGRRPTMLMGSGMREDEAGRLLSLAFSGEAVRTDDWVARKKDGSEFPVEVRLRRLDVEEGAAPRVLATIRDVSEERARTEAMQRAEARYRAMFETNRAVKLLIDPDEAVILDANPAAADMYGYALDELRGMSIGDLNVTRPVEVIRSAMRRAKGERQLRFRFQHRRKDGEVLDVEIHSGPIEIEGRTVLFSIIHDISEQKRLEQQLSDAQKMEALGRLAAGVAHDFSNLMQVVLASTELARAHLSAEHPASSLLADVRHAGNQAASLTRQLLAFGRGQVLAPRPLELNRTLDQMYGMLASLIGPRVRVVRSFSRAPAHVMADPAQLEQVLLNLVLNARDALPGGGTLVLRTSHTELASGEVPGLAGGRYVELAVEDDGVGIPAEDLPHLFEPFFSSKDERRGTGLGLALVYGIITQSGGHVSVESEPGAGSRFRILLPEARAAATELPAPYDRERRTTQSLTALLVDDDVVVRRVLELTLEHLGWRVFSARDGEAAERLAVAIPGALDALITDLRMPGLAGPRLAERVRALRPEVAVLYISGGTEGLDVRVDEDPRAAFLQKPVSREDLRSALERVLARTK